MAELIPALDWQRVFVVPWTQESSVSLWIVLMGFLVIASCGLVGNYLLLRRMLLVGDAISHSILPGVVVAFLTFQQNSLPVTLLGALSAGLCTVLLIEAVHRHFRIKPETAICVVYTTLFASGVVLVSLLEASGGIHIDTECILFGEIGYVALQPPVELWDWQLPPFPVLQMLGVCTAVVLLIAIFYKELLITSFDSAFAGSLGMKTTVWQNGLMVVLALVVVFAFEAVGAILAVAMLIVPSMFAAQLSQKLVVRHGWVFVHAAIAAFTGYHLSVWLNCSIAGAIVVVSSGMFVLVWWGSVFLDRSRICLRAVRGVCFGTKEV